MDKRPPPCSKRELYKNLELCTSISISYDQTLLHFSSAFYESLGWEIVLSRLNHPHVLLVLMHIMKVLVETDDETEWYK